jgi:hypothetical protein
LKKGKRVQRNLKFQRVQAHADDAKRVVLSLDAVSSISGAGKAGTGLAAEEYILIILE